MGALRETPLFTLSNCKLCGKTVGLEREDRCKHLKDFHKDLVKWILENGQEVINDESKKG